MTIGSMRISFLRTKPQPEHDQSVLARAKRFPSGVTSNTPIHLWDRRNIHVTRMEEVIGDLMLERDEWAE